MFNICPISSQVLYKEANKIMNEISHKIDVWRHVLHNEINNTINLSNNKILKRN
ncbi:hypothetical protein CNEO2_620006 [Clostridium neonatale]|nr:hypothetical protein CNEO2_620006 [Clostridium neonatale]CAI3630481.1 hypothetical protein CNEO4_600006 [Clostridium neonatale]